jgi:hypothetical protein
MDADTKFMEELAKTTGKAIENLPALREALAAAFGPISEVWSLAASAIRQKREYLEAKWKLENAVAIGQLLYEKYSSLSITLDDLKPLPPRIAYDYREGIETEDSPELQEL